MSKPILERALKFFESGRYNEAKIEFLKCNDSFVNIANYYLGFMHEFGLCTYNNIPDLIEAIKNYYEIYERGYKNVSRCYIRAYESSKHLHNKILKDYPQMNIHQLYNDLLNRPIA
jgi:hypothetical protein